MQEDEEQDPLAAEGAFGYGAAGWMITAIAEWTAIPGAGFLAGGLLARVVPHPIVKRQQDLLRDLNRRLSELETKGLISETNLSENEEFLDVVVEAVRIAAKTSSETRRKAVVNAAANTAAGISFNEVVRGSFLGYLDRFSSLHLTILQYLGNPGWSLRKATTPEGRALEMALKHGHRDTIVQGLDRVLSDLKSERLITRDLDECMEKGLQPDLTEVGRAFVRFIGDPEEAEPRSRVPSRTYPNHRSRKSFKAGRDPGWRQT